MQISVHVEDTRFENVDFVDYDFSILLKIASYRTLAL